MIKLLDHKPKDDITRDLKSLSFEHSLTGNEEKYEVLRSRLSTITLSCCRSAAYIVSCMNNIRNACIELTADTTRKPNIFNPSSNRRKATKIGIIGGGRLCKSLLQVLFDHANVLPEDIAISTRKPNNNDFQKLGIRHTFNNRYIVQTCSIVFLMCLPSHINDIVQELQGQIPVDCFIYSFLPSISLYRLKKLLGHNNVAKNEVTWTRSTSSQASEVSSEPSDDMSIALSSQITKEEICEKSEKYMEVVLYTTLNIFPTLEVQADQIIQIMNREFLSSCPSQFSWNSFLENSEAYTNESQIPFFDIYHVGTNDTPVTEVLKNDKLLRHALNEKFIKTFNKTF